MKSVLPFFIFCLLLSGCNQPEKKKTIEVVGLGHMDKLDAPSRLKDWNLFEEPMAALNPKVGVIPYEINSPLFSDYALKQRFFKLPTGSTIQYNPSDVLDFPTGSILVKNFYYQSDLTKPESERRIIETRLLINEAKGWNALTYVWNEAQTEAHLEVAGSTIPVEWINESGVLAQVNYSVPNLVQCKSCHERGGQMSLIGPSARQLNKTISSKGSITNQLINWDKLAILTGLPSTDSIPKLAEWGNAKSGTLDQRARGWLEVNCAHCHRSDGPAKNSGLHLLASETDLYKLGINKPPVAAGRGSGGLKYGIVPGKPDESILVHRIESLDPGVMMPEVGRKMMHEEGVELIRQWIEEM